VIRKSIEWCTLPSQIRKLCGHGDTLIRKSISAWDRVCDKRFGTKGKIMCMSSKIYNIQLAKIQHGERLAATTELNLAPSQVTGCSVVIP